MSLNKNHLIDLKIYLEKLQKFNLVVLFLYNSLLTFDLTVYFTAKSFCVTENIDWRSEPNLAHVQAFYCIKGCHESV